METLRLYPTVSETQRVALKDTRLDGQFIPKGTRFLVLIWQTQRSSHLWGPRAEEFYPERWIDFSSTDDEKAGAKSNNHGGAQSNYALMTFGHGPRGCIGQGFAKAELRALVASWVHTFEFELANPDEEVVAFGAVAIKPKDGLKLRVRAVDSS
jgi:cytochrome P450